MQKISKFLVTMILINSFECGEGHARVSCDDTASQTIEPGIKKRFHSLREKWKDIANSLAKEIDFTFLFQITEFFDHMEILNTNNPDSYNTLISGWLKKNELDKLDMNWHLVVEVFKNKITTQTLNLLRVELEKAMSSIGHAEIKTSKEETVDTVEKLNQERIKDVKIALEKAFAAQKLELYSIYGEKTVDEFIRLIADPLFIKGNNTGEEYLNKVGIWLACNQLEVSDNSGPNYLLSLANLSTAIQEKLSSLIFPDPIHGFSDISSLDKWVSLGVFTLTKEDVWLNYLIEVFNLINNHGKEDDIVELNRIYDELSCNHEKDRETGKILIESWLSSEELVKDGERLQKDLLEEAVKKMLKAREVSRAQQMQNLKPVVQALDLLTTKMPVVAYPVPYEAVKAFLDKFFIDEKDLSIVHAIKSVIRCLSSIKLMSQALKCLQKELYPYSVNVQSSVIDEIRAEFANQGHHAVALVKRFTAIDPVADQQCEYLILILKGSNQNEWQIHMIKDKTFMELKKLFSCYEMSLAQAWPEIYLNSEFSLFLSEDRSLRVIDTCCGVSSEDTSAKIDGVRIGGSMYLKKNGDKVEKRLDDPKRWILKTSIGPVVFSGSQVIKKLLAGQDKLTPVFGCLKLPKVEALIEACDKP